MVKTITLSEAATIRRGASPRPIANPKWFDESGKGRGWIRISDVTASHVTLTRTEQYLSPLGEAKSVAVNPGDLIMSICASVGVPRFVGIPACIHDGFVVFSDYERVLDKRFLFHYLTEFAPIVAKTYGQHGSQTNLNTGLVGDMEIPIFPMSEQKAIADHIDTFDRATSIHEEYLRCLHSRRLALMQQLLTGKKRISGHNTPWNSVHLGDIFQERSENNRTDLHLLSITGDDGVVPRCEDRKDTSSEDKSKYLRICPGDIGYNTMRMWQGVCGLSRHEGILSPAYTVVTPGPKIDGEFAAILFKFPPVVNLFRRHSQGLVDDTLNLKFHHFAQIKVTIPPVVEQRAIVKVFTKADAEISVLERLTSAYRSQKKGLMQQLLTGKRRVKVQAA